MNLAQTFPMILPIKDGVVWNGLPADLSNLPQWNVQWTQSFAGNPAMYEKFGMKGHNGLDIAYKKGTPIVAPIDMDIQDTTNDKEGYGIYVRAYTDVKSIDGKNVFLDLVFGHLDSKVVKARQRVKRGEIIGYGDSTGFSTGHHLHFGIRPYVAGKIPDYNNGFFGYIDPEPFLPKVRWTFGELDKLRQNEMKFYKEVGDSAIYQKGADGIYYPINSGKTFKRLYGEFEDYVIEEVPEITPRGERLGLLI